MDAKTHTKDDLQKETVHCLDDDDETEIQKDDVIQGMVDFCFGHPDQGFSLGPTCL